MTTLILAEKPSQATDYSKAFQKVTKKKGYFEVSNEVFNEKTYITWAVGHLIELSQPHEYDEKYKIWNSADLPIFPNKMKFKVSERTKPQFKIVKDLMNEATTIIIATDPDREGENIAWSIIEKAKANTGNKTFKRLWINSLEEDVVLNGLNNLLNAEDTKNKYYEAQTRQIADWLIGMNASRLFSLELQKNGIKDSFSIGRVQTPTLFMIYDRNRTIESFKKEKYYQISIDYKKDGINFKGILKPNTSFKTKDELIHYLKEEGLETGLNKARIESVTAREKKESSPSLFSLSDLQKTANKLYKKSPKETLSAVQKLYDSKCLTYPRTSSVYITDNEFNYLRDNLESYKEFLGVSLQTPNVNPRKQYVNNDKVLEHHAIVLTKKVPNKQTFETFSTFEQQIYNLVAVRTVSMFLSDYIYQETIVQTKVNNLLFESKGTVPIVQGWKELSSKKETEKALPKISENDILEGLLKSEEKETTPPSYFTEGTLLSSMKTLGKDLELKEEREIMKDVQGLGTEATRGDIIETLKKGKLINVEKNKIVVTEKGKLLCQAVEPEKLLSSAEMTSKWELYLKKIGEGKGEQNVFINNIKKFITHLLEVTPNNIKNINFKGYENVKEIEYQQSIVGTCMKCGKNMIDKNKFYGCSDYPNCKFAVSNNFRGKKLSKTQINKLLKKEEVIVKSIKKKGTKDTYNARIILEESGHFKMISFEK